MTSWIKDIYMRMLKFRTLYEFDQYMVNHSEYEALKYCKCGKCRAKILTYIKGWG
jgi:hypothetical protein